VSRAPLGSCGPSRAWGASPRPGWVRPFPSLVPLVYGERWPGGARNPSGGRKKNGNVPPRVGPLMKFTKPASKPMVCSARANNAEFCPPPPVLRKKKSRPKGPLSDRETVWAFGSPGPTAVSRPRTHGSTKSAPTRASAGVSPPLRPGGAAAHLGIG